MAWTQQPLPRQRRGLITSASAGLCVLFGMLESELEGSGIDRILPGFMDMALDTQGSALHLSDQIMFGQHGDGGPINVCVDVALGNSTSGDFGGGQAIMRILVRLHAERTNRDESRRGSDKGDGEDGIPAGTFGKSSALRSRLQAIIGPAWLRRPGAGAVLEAGPGTEPLSGAQSPGPTALGMRRVSQSAAPVVVPPAPKSRASMRSAFTLPDECVHACMSAAPTETTSASPRIVACLYSIELKSV